MTYDIGALDVILVSLNLGLKVVDRDLLVLDDEIDLQLFDTKADRDQLRSTPR